MVPLSATKKKQSCQTKFKLIALNSGPGTEEQKIINIKKDQKLKTNIQESGTNLKLTTKRRPYKTTPRLPPLLSIPKTRLGKKLRKVPTSDLIHIFPVSYTHLTLPTKRIV